MKKKPKFKSDAFEAIHSAVSGMYEVGIVSKETMRRFDESCLSVSPELESKEIKPDAPVEQK